MPLVEAMALGVPVIASDLPVFREIAGEIPEYLEPLDGVGWRRMILDYMQPNGMSYRAQRERLKHYVAPTWESRFAVVQALLEEVRA